MIGKLKGLIDSYGEDFVILDVGGVGYQVHCSARTLQTLPSPGGAAVLSIETYVREDQIKVRPVIGSIFLPESLLFGPVCVQCTHG